VWTSSPLSGAEYCDAIAQKLNRALRLQQHRPHQYWARHTRISCCEVRAFLFGMAGPAAYTRRQDSSPKNPAEFWDTNSFTGERSLYSGIFGRRHLGDGLLADGVPLTSFIPSTSSRRLRRPGAARPQHSILHNTNSEPILSTQVPPLLPTGFQTGASVAEPIARVANSVGTTRPFTSGLMAIPIA